MLRVRFLICNLSRGLLRVAWHQHRRRMCLLRRKMSCLVLPTRCSVPHTGCAKNGATNARPWFRHFLTYLRNFFTEIFLNKFAVNWISKIPPHLASCMCCCTTSRNVNVSKTAINDKLQGSVATCLRYGGIVNNQMKKLLLLSLRVNFYLNRWILGKVTSKNVWLSRALVRSAKRRRKYTKQSRSCS